MILILVLLNRSSSRMELSSQRLNCETTL